MAVVIKITQLEEGVDLRPRQLSKYTKAAHQEVGYRWQIDMLPRHFTPAAASIYRHQRRTAAYLRKKRRLARARPDLVREGGQTDLVFTGLLKRLMKRRHQVRAYPSRVTIVMHGPRYLRMQPKNPRHPNKAREILTVLPSERRQLEEVAEKAFERAMQRSRRRRKKTIT